MFKNYRLLICLLCLLHGQAHAGFLQGVAAFLNPHNATSQISLVTSDTGYDAMESGSIISMRSVKKLLKWTIICAGLTILTSCTTNEVVEMEFDYSPTYFEKKPYITPIPDGFHLGWDKEGANDYIFKMGEENRDEDAQDLVMFDYNYKKSAGIVNVKGRVFEGSFDEKNQLTHIFPYVEFQTSIPIGDQESRLFTFSEVKGDNADLIPGQKSGFVVSMIGSRERTVNESPYVDVRFQFAFGANVSEDPGEFDWRPATVVIGNKPVSNFNQLFQSTNSVQSTALGIIEGFFYAEANVTGEGSFSPSSHMKTDWAGIDRRATDENGQKINGVENPDAVDDFMVFLPLRHDLVGVVYKNITQPGSIDQIELDPTPINLLAPGFFNFGNKKFDHTIDTGDYNGDKLTDLRSMVRNFDAPEMKDHKAYTVIIAINQGYNSETNTYEFKVGEPDLVYMPFTRQTEKFDDNNTVRGSNCASLVRISGNNSYSYANKECQY